MMDIWYLEDTTPDEDQVVVARCNWADHDYYWDRGHDWCPLCGCDLDA